MAGDLSLFDVSYEAAADLSAGIYKGVVIDATGKVALAGAAADIDGILLNDPPAAGDAAHVRHFGVTYAYAGTGGVTAGDALATDASGNFVTAGVGNPIVAKALTSAAAGERFTLLLRGYYGDA